MKTVCYLVGDGVGLKSSPNLVELHIVLYNTQSLKIQLCVL